MFWCAFSFFQSPHCKTVLNKPLRVLLPALCAESQSSHPHNGAPKQSRKLWTLRAAFLAHYLIPITCKAAALHGAGVEVALVVELEDGQAAVDVVEHGRQAPPQRQQLRAVAVEAHAHGALEGQVPTVAEQGTGKRQVGL